MIVMSRPIVIRFDPTPAFIVRWRGGRVIVDGWEYYSAWLMGSAWIWVSEPDE